MIRVIAVCALIVLMGDGFFFCGIVCLHKRHVLGEDLYGEWTALTKHSCRDDECDER